MGIRLSHFEDSDWSAWRDFDKRKFIKIHFRCRVLRKISWEKLWKNFLESSNTSCAIAAPELTSLFTASLHDSNMDDVSPAELKAEIEDYFEFVKERNSLGNESSPQTKLLDFISVFSSILLISEDHLEEKIDTLFELTDFNSDGIISLDELYLTMTSVDRGLAYILGQSPSSSKYIFAVSKIFFSLSELGRESENVDPRSELAKKKFFEFCTNRQHSVRRLFELFGNAKIQKNENAELKEVVTADKLSCPSLDEPTGGDEWMANPAWKKTAEIMTPKSHTGNPSRPASNLQLEWVHGYRGFDCRNNVRYANKDGDEIIYTAAALGVVQSTENESACRTQRYFGEHTDDIVSISVYTPPAEGKDATVATGEMGKVPAVHLWESSNAGMVSLASMSGFHTKAVCQLAHSCDGQELFTVGLEYTVAVYNVEKGHKNFGKQVCSAQGPKGKIFHACAYGKYDEKSKVESKFVTCGEKHVAFWSVDLKKSKMTQTMAKLKRNHSNMMFLSAASVGNSDNVLVGTASGELLFFSDPNGQPKELNLKSSKSYPKSILALWSYDGDGGCYVLVGCKEGMIYRYVITKDGSSISLEGCCKVQPIRNCSFSTEKDKKKSIPIRSIAASADGSKILVGNQKCEIIELESNTAFGKPGPTPASLVEPVGKTLVAGHFKDEVWGLAIRPGQEGDPIEYATVGDDEHLRIFNMKKHEQTHGLDMGTMARCCAFSPDGSMLAVGYGGRVGRGRQKDDGMFRIYRVDTTLACSNEEWITLIHEGRDAKQWISDIKFSDDGRILAVGSKDNNIYVYLVAQKFKLKFKFSRHNSYITHFDISKDCQYMQSNCGAYELLFCSLKNGKPILKGSSLSNVEWASWTCPLGWPVQGIWPPSADGTDINAVDRSPSGDLLVTADDFGKIKLFNYPCVDTNAKSCEYSGHSSHVTNVRWASNDAESTYVVSVGGNDKCIFQWKHITSDEKNIDQNTTSSNASRGVGTATFELEEPSGGDEFMAVKPWKGAIKAPSNFGTVDKTRVVQFFAALGDLSNKHADMHSKFEGCWKKHALTIANIDYDGDKIYDDVIAKCAKVNERLIDSGYASNDMPDNDEIELSWVNGYRGFDCRNNLYYAGSKQEYIVYFTANVGIVLNKETREQLYFHGHTDDILSMATISMELSAGDPKVQVVASGQRGKSSTLIWTAPDMTLKATLETGQKSISMLEFSKDGRLLISLAEDNTVAVSDWANQRVVAKVDGEPATTYHLSRFNGTAGKNSPLFMTCGDKYIRLWKLSGRNLTSSKVSTLEHGTPQKFLSAVHFINNWIVGCLDGSLYVINDEGKMIKAIPKKDKESKKEKNARNKADKKNQEKKKKLPPITSIYCNDEVLITGDKNGILLIWDKDMKQVSSIDTPELVNKACNGIYKLVGPTRQIQSVSCVGTTSDCSILVGTRGCDVLEVKVQEGNGRICEGSPLIQGHANDELWGLAIHPTKPVYCTVGDDKTLRLWSCHSRRMLRCVPIGSMARACDFNPSGELIAVGFGGRVGRSSRVSQKDDGMVRIYSTKDILSTPDVNDITAMVEIKDAKQWISDIKFSPDGDALAVGSHNNTIYIYDIEPGDPTSRKKSAFVLKIRAKFSKHNSYITHFDFSVDSRFLQSNCGAYELLFCDTSNGKQITSATELRDVKWSTWTGTLGWPVQGIWPPGADGTDINAVCRSHSGHLVAASDDFGMVRVMKYPCVEEGAEALSCAGHSSHVMNVRWTVGDEYLISVGGNDKSIFQWKHTISSLEGSSGGNVDAPDDEDQTEPIDDNEVPEASTFELEEPTGGDEFMAVKPWRGAIRAPEHPPPIDPSSPSANLSLQWVHGYTSGSAGSNNSRISSNLFYNMNNDIVYPAAALGVTLKYSASNPSDSSQSYFTGHDDDVLCLAISADRKYCATGQTASKSSKGTGKICVWDAVDGRLLSEMTAAHKRGVVSVSFNPEGDQLVSIGLDDNFTHCLWSDVGGGWSRVKQTATSKSDQKTHLYSIWIRDSKKFGYNFMSGGSKSIHFWKIEGSSMTKKESRFGKHPQKPILCAAGLLMKDDNFVAVAGSSSGNLYVFGKDRECKNMIENAHDGPIVTLAGSKENDFVISGGYDKCIRIWNQALQAITNCKIEQDIKKSPVDATVASIDYRYDDSNNLVVLVGTYGGEIMEISSNTSSDSLNFAKPSQERDLSKPVNFDLVTDNTTCILHSHYSGELWAAAPHPSDPDIIATGGDDKTLRIWSVKQRKMLSCIVTNKEVRCVCWDPHGAIVCAGFKGAGKGKKKSKKKGKKKAADKESNLDGPVPDMSSHGCAVFSFSKESKELQFVAAGCPSGDYWVSDIKISSGGSYLAVGSHSKQLYVYNVPKGKDGKVSQSSDLWKTAFAENKGKGRFPPFNKHSSAITHFDFSNDEKYFQSNCQAYELLFGSLDNGKQKTKATELAVYNQDKDYDGDDAEDKAWSTFTCTLGWPVQGIWQEGAGGSDINSVDRSKSESLLVTSDDFGLVNLYRYPCVEEDSKYKSYHGHSSHVTNVRWNADDSQVVSVGGNDKCLFIWNVEK